ncbi:uncharacterized conserved protein [Lentilactobacillus kosonis]|uniref:Uncharacterized conserved protein n=1 Tax=Lentilactobacillus kosonis TaxID=2810561 RepID=A0A401FJ75_9LACO|nr:uncharacterized conserved protein [Lentilactobacillus kosonis]
MELVRQYMTDKRYKTSLVVNHPELYKAYQDIAESIPGMKVNDIRRPTSLINYAQKNNKKYDIILSMKPTYFTQNQNHMLITEAKTN